MSPFTSPELLLCAPVYVCEGIGQWNAWTRNFNSPLLALLDLFDNSVDAAMKPAKRNGGTAMTDNDAEDEDYRGRIEVEADWWSQSMFGDDDSDRSDEDYEDVDGAPMETITGLVVTNNSYRHIKPLEKILEAYSSAKGREEHGEDHNQEGEYAETIGENGVGLKQGCAVLSNLSFVLIRRGDSDENKFSLGVIAKQLQRPEGISLPSVEFVSRDLASLRQEMTSLFTGTAVGECVNTYGEGSLDAGVTRLMSHFQQMSSKRNGKWGHFGQVFRVVMHAVKGSSASNSNCRALSLMDEIYSALPATYIHLPQNIEVKVNGQAIQFNYYQSRLIELTTFCRKIDIAQCVGDGDGWQDQDRGHYNVRFMFGFDGSRKGGRPRLCIHSRHSGRLVKSIEDCRAILGLTTGSSDFCQGLTVIVDDMDGHLPLNPTKQDIAFGEQGEAGDVHRRNLLSWIGGYTSLFYAIHKEKKFGGSKMALSAAISRLSSQQDAFTWYGPCLNECFFTKYENITWKFIKATGNIRCGNLKKVSAVIGNDTRWQFDYLPEVAYAAHAASPPRSSPRPKKKRRAQSCTSSGEASTPRSEPPEPDYKKMYEEIVMEHEGLKEKYQKKKDLVKQHKDMAKEYYEKSEQYVEKSNQLETLLDIERRRRKEELEEKDEELREKDKDLRAKDEKIERLKKRNMRLEERIDSLDSIHVSSQQRSNGQVGSGTRQVTL